jgi:hypothetical protein
MGFSMIYSYVILQTLRAVSLPSHKVHTAAMFVLICRRKQGRSSFKVLMIPKFHENAPIFSKIMGGVADML